MVRGGQIQERWSRMVRNGQKPERWSERKGELGRVMGVEGGHQRKGRQRKPERRGGPKCLERSGRDVKYGQRQSQVKSGLDKGQTAGER